MPPYCSNVTLSMSVLSFACGVMSVNEDICLEKSSSFGFRVLLVICVYTFPF